MIKLNLDEEILNQAFSNEEISKLHPDPLIANQVAIDILLGALATTRAALTRVIGLQVATENGISVKDCARAALSMTHPGSLMSQHINKG